MDIVAILNLLNQGGPTVLFVILAGLLWMQHLTIVDLKRDLDAYMVRPALQGINFVEHEGKVAPIYPAYC